MTPTPPPNIPAQAWDSIGAKPDADGWKIPERNAEGEIVGWSRRFADGRKSFVKGGKRGITLAWPLAAYAGSSASDPVFVCEGASDAAAGVTLKLSTVGRPSATGGGILLASLLAGRHACIVAENDQKPGKALGSVSWPGKDGANAIARTLLPKCASVRIIYPPDGTKDLRSWLADGVAREDILELVNQTEPLMQDQKLRHGDAIMLCMADVKTVPIEWLWPGRIPRGRLTLLSGRPGVGKSFATCAMASRISTGRPWPDSTECKQGSVVFVSAEDDPADTIKPRLDAHDADMKRIHVLKAVATTDDRGDQREDAFTLRDLAPLERALERIGDVSLVVVDPIGSYLGGGVDNHKDNEVRSVLAPLAAMAERLDVAVVLVAHQRKSLSNHADSVVMGSVAFTGIARAVLHLLRDPDDDDKRLLLSGKMNLCKPAPGLSFTIGDEPARVCWSEKPETRTADEIMASHAGNGGTETPATDEAEDWLRDTLESNGGSMPAKEIKEQAKADGIDKGALDRAKKRLGVKPSREGGSKGRWIWPLPQAQDPEDISFTADGFN